MLDAAADLIGGVGGRRGQWTAARRRRWEEQVLRELATDTVERPGRLRLLFVPAVLAGNIRLLAGMVRANRPWRFTVRLYGALVAALAAGAFGVIASDVWSLAAAMGWWRLAILSLGSVAGTVIAIISAHGLWERAPDARVREQGILFNFASAATVAIGILSMYLAVFVIVLAGTGLVIAPAVMERAIQERATLVDYIHVA